MSLSATSGGRPRGLNKSQARPVITKGGPGRRGIGSGLLVAILLLFPGCGDDEEEHHHHHECDPPCQGADVCHHEGICGLPCTDPENPTVCETYVDSEIFYCQPEDGICEHTGRNCTLTDLSACARFQVCQIFVEAGTCASPCQDVGGDEFCRLLDPVFVCHRDAANGICGPPCVGAGGSVRCSQLPSTEPGETLVCNVDSGQCEAQP